MGKGQALSQEIAQVVARIDLSEYTESAVRLAKDGILDYLGVAVAGATDPFAPRLSNVLSPARVGEATHIGSPDKGNWIDAALFNGFVSHVLDFDDMSDSIRGHPSGPVLSALLPLAEICGATGRDVLVSYMAGVDGMALIGKDLATAVQHVGYHPTAVLGSVGSALACGKLLRLAVEELTSAISMALAQAGGMEANFGTPAKPMQVGLAAAAGGRAAQFAKAGFTASASPIESLIRTFRAPAKPLASSGHLEAARFSDWELQRVRFKRYPSCWLTHQAIEAGKLVRARCHPSDITKVDVLGSYRVERMLQYPIPRDRYQAKFSLPYCLAVALLYEEPLIPHLASGELDQGAVDLARRVNFAVHPDLMGPAAIDREFTSVCVTLTSGKRLEVRTDEKVAMSNRNELLDKVEACFAMSNVRTDLSALIREVDYIDHLPSVQAIMRLVRPQVHR
jgi:2-methylcitrate dehydratase PrpD